MVAAKIEGSSQSILWLPVVGLAVVQGSIALTWVIYNLYLVDLLTQLGFASALAAVVLGVENILGIVMEPLMGSLADRRQRWLGSRFPLIAIGILLSAFVFVLIPMVVVIALRVPPDLLAGSLLAGVRWLLPIFLVAWALSMTVFRSPALSLLGRYAFGSGLPQAASILTLVGGLAGALGPMAGGGILERGPWLAFGLGSAVLVVAALVLRSVDPGMGVEEEEATSRPSGSLSWAGLGCVFGAGVGIALGFRLMMTLLPVVLQEQGPDAPVGLIMGMIFVALAVTAIPSGALARQIGNPLAMVLGLGLMGSLLGSLLWIQSPGLSIAAVAGLGAAFSLVSNGTIPFALSMVPPTRAGLGTGIFFSGGAAASSVFGILFRSPDAISTQVGLIIGVIAFLSAGFWVALSQQLKGENPVLG